MTEDEARVFWNRYLLYRMSGQRDGQAAFNALHEVAPIIADMIRGTNADPFYQDELLPEFFKTIGEPTP